MYKHTQSPVNRAGFTLVELLVVLVILVLLFGLVGPRILGAQAKADIKTTQIDIGNLESALEFFAVDMRTFPTSEEGLQALLAAPVDENRSQNWDGPYLDSEDLPVDAWGNAYRYSYPPENGKRDFPNIWSPGKDGQDNTDDDIVNWKKDPSQQNGEKASSANDRNN
jgi:general secretion pathway protein G